MNRFMRLYLTFDRLRAGISRKGSRRFSAAETTSLAKSFKTPSVFLSRGVSLAAVAAPLEFPVFLDRFAISRRSGLGFRVQDASNLEHRLDHLATSMSLAFVFARPQLGRRMHFIVQRIDNQHAAAVIFRLRVFDRFAASSSTVSASAVFFLATSSNLSYRFLALVRLISLTAVATSPR